MNILSRLADEILGIGDGALYSSICILVVFAVLAIIILVSYGSSNLVDYAQTKNTKEVTGNKGKLLFMPGCRWRWATGAVFPSGAETRNVIYCSRNT